MPLTQQHDAMFLELEAQDEELKRLRDFVDFVNRWCHRESGITAAERLSMIMFHPVAKSRHSVE